MENLQQFTDEPLNLEITAEECAETIEELTGFIKDLTDVIKIKAKAVRFGLDDIYPERGHSNRAALEEELGHLQAMMDILVAKGTVTREGIESGRAHKLAKLPKWYGTQPERTTVKSLCDSCAPDDGPCELQHIGIVAEGGTCSRYQEITPL
jgi:hypothetical protein